MELSLLRSFRAPWKMSARARSTTSFLPPSSSGLWQCSTQLTLTVKKYIFVQNMYKLYVHQCQAQNTLSWPSTELQIIWPSPDPYMEILTFTWNLPDYTVYMTFTWRTSDVHLTYTWCSPHLTYTWRSPDSLIPELDNCCQALVSSNYKCP